MQLVNVRHFVCVCVCVHRTFSPRSRKWFKPFVRGTVRTEKQSPALFTARNGVMARLYSRKVAQNFCFETETSLNTRISRLCSESLAKTQHVCSTSNFTYLLLLLTFELIRSTIWKNNRSALCNCKCEGPTLSSAGGGLQPFYAFKLKNACPRCTQSMPTTNLQFCLSPTLRPNRRHSIYTVWKKLKMAWF